MNTILMPYLDCPQMTKVAIDDCLKQSIGQVRLLLIDNGSQPEGRAVGDDAARTYHIPGEQEVLVWHHAPAMLSLAACWNRALQFVWESGESYALVVNNDVRLHTDTYAVLLEVLKACDAWFVSGVGVTAAQFDPTLDLRWAVGQPTEARKDGQKPQGYHYGGPDFSCFVITKACHRWFQFDEAFIPAYHEDNDFHRRLQLAGFGEKIFGVNVPFLHFGSGTLNENPELRARWGPQFAACQQYYIRKWGGLPGSETYHYPFEPPEPELNRTRPYLYAGQGKPPYNPELVMAELFHA